MFIPGVPTAEGQSTGLGISLIIGKLHASLAEDSLVSIELS